MFKTKKTCISYTKWGYIFLIPFFLIYTVFSFIPLITTFYNSLFENYMSGLSQIGPNFVGLANFKAIFANNDVLKYGMNTLIIWLWGFVPQIIVSLLLAVWFTDIRLKIKGVGFYKTVMYMPNLIMAAAFSMLFFTLFSDSGPVNQILIRWGIIREPFRFLSNVAGARGLIALMNFLMWFGNTTILLMAGIMGIDVALIEAAEVDGAGAFQVFKSIIMPLLRPILIFVLITSLIGGVQMFDVPEILTNSMGTPNNSTMTLIMYLNKHLYSKNYGVSGALSVILFIFTAILSLFVYFKLTKDQDGGV